MNLDSKEELYFSWWCEELEDAGYIDSFGNAKTYQLGEKIVNKYTEQLKTKTKEKEQIILNSCEYTPDFQIYWNKKSENIFYDLLYKDYPIPVNINRKVNLDLIIAKEESVIYSIIEIKPDFDKNNMTRLNGINRKWMYQKHDIFINLVKVPDIFKDTFTPSKYLMTDSGKQQRLIHFPIITLEEYVSNKAKGTTNDIQESTLSIPKTFDSIE